MQDAGGDYAVHGAPVGVRQVRGPFIDGVPNYGQLICIVPCHDRSLDPYRLVNDGDQSSSKLTDNKPYLRTEWPPHQAFPLLRAKAPHQYMRSGSARLPGWAGRMLMVARPAGCTHE